MQLSHRALRVAVAAGIFLTATPSWACYFCQQGIECNQESGGLVCRMSTTCTLILGPCVGCTWDCQDPRGKCNQSIYSPCGYASQPCEDGVARKEVLARWEPVSPGTAEPGFL